MRITATHSQVLTAFRRIQREKGCGAILGVCAETHQHAGLLFIFGSQCLFYYDDQAEELTIGIIDKFRRASDEGIERDIRQFFSKLET